MDGLIRVRERVLDGFAGVAEGDVFNVAEDAVSSLMLDSGIDVNIYLKDLVNPLRVEAFSSGGDAVHYARLQHSAAYRNYREGMRHLVGFDPAQLVTSGARLAFWINLYNALILDAVIARGVRQSVIEGPLGILTFFRGAAYRIGGQRVSAEDIEHGILRANRGNPFIPGPHFPSGDRRLDWRLSMLDPRVHFALNCASVSCPPIAFYDAARIDAQLDLAARNFVTQTTMLDRKHEALRVSRLFRWFASDFGGRSGVLQFVLHHLPPGEERTWLENQGQAVKLVYASYDWRLNTALEGE